MSAAAGDQLVASLVGGSMAGFRALKPSITLLDDVHHSNLNILMDHEFAGDSDWITKP